MQNSPYNQYLNYQEQVERFLSRNGTIVDTHAFSNEEISILKRLLESHETKLESESCPICMEDITNESAKLIHPICHHRFHSDCLVAWLGRKASCPVCRRGSRTGMLKELTGNVENRLSGGEN